MYLTGEAFFTHEHANRKIKPHPIKQTEYELAYWRKHPNLHGYIVSTFADGEDNCKKIWLGEDHLKKIIATLEGKEELPHTEGFFFGTSDNTPEERAEDLKIFKDALAWVQTKEADVWKEVYYQASW